MLSQPPRSAWTPAKEKDGLISPKSFSWDTGLKNVRLERAKTLYLWKGDQVGVRKMGSDSFQWCPMT